MSRWVVVESFEDGSSPDVISHTFNSGSEAEEFIRDLTESRIRQGWPRPLFSIHRITVGE